MAPAENEDDPEMKLVLSVSKLTSEFPNLEFSAVFEQLSAAEDWTVLLDAIYDVERAKKGLQQVKEGRASPVANGVKDERMEDVEKLVAAPFAQQTPSTSSFNGASSSTSSETFADIGYDCGDDFVQPGPSSSGRKRKASSEEEQETLPWLTRDQTLTLTLRERQALLTVCQIVPTVDPEHVYSLIINEELHEELQLVEHLFGNTFPTLQQRIRSEASKSRREAYFDEASFSVADFLAMYTDPKEFFDNDQRKVNENYTNHALAFLNEQFPRYTLDFFKRQLTDNGGLLLRVYRILAQQIADRSIKGKAVKFAYRQYRRLDDPPNVAPYPVEVDEVFFREAQFCLFGKKIEEWKEAKKREREEKLTEAESAGKLTECVICCNDRLLMEDMVECSLQIHSFCSDCVKMHANTQLGDGATHVRCMDDTCKDGRYSFAVLQTLLPSASFQLLVRRSQQEELRSANLQNFESCPFCDYAMIIENDQEHIFRCLNPNCQKESCRACHEVAHVPLRCDEVEKDFETKRRKFIEECMSKAVIRKCPKCSNSITKESGCNKMICPCGTFFCYVCNAALPVQHPYSHFGRKCPQDTSLAALHEQAAKRAGEKALKLFSEQNPEALGGKVPDIAMLAGVKNEIEKQPKGQRRGRHVHWQDGNRRPHLEMLPGQVPPQYAGMPAGGAPAIPLFEQVGPNDLERWEQRREEQHARRERVFARRREQAAARREQMAAERAQMAAERAQVAFRAQFDFREIAERRQRRLPNAPAPVDVPAVRGDVDELRNRVVILSEPEPKAR